jgi:hypothetical protein
MMRQAAGFQSFLLFLKWFSIDALHASILGHEAIVKVAA